VSEAFLLEDSCSSFSSTSSKSAGSMTARSSFPDQQKDKHVLTSTSDSPPMEEHDVDL
jgi:hypothetical protein